MRRDKRLRFLITVKKLAKKPRKSAKFQGKSSITPHRSILPRPFRGCLSLLPAHRVVFPCGSAGMLPPRWKRSSEEWTSKIPPKISLPSLKLQELKALASTSQEAPGFRHVCLTSCTPAKTRPQAATQRTLPVNPLGL